MNIFDQMRSDADKHYLLISGNSVDDYANVRLVGNELEVIYIANWRWGWIERTERQFSKGVLVSITQTEGVF